MATMASLGSGPPSSSFTRGFRLRSLSGSVDLERSTVSFSSSVVSCENGSAFMDGAALSIGSTSVGSSRLRCLKHNSWSCTSDRNGDVCVTVPFNRSHSSTAAESSTPEVDESLQFEELPVPCKLKIFSFLSTVERGAAARVCTDWSRLMRQPGLWSTVDLTVFPSCPLALKCDTAHHLCTMSCYHAYRTRVAHFVQYLLTVKPVIRELRFSLDIGDTEDGWMEQVQDLLKVSRCKELCVADLTWTETPAKKQFLPDTSVTWSNSDFKELSFRRRHRKRHFVRLFDLFTAMAPALTVLRLPFDWSARSCQVIGRLKNLRTLELRRYFQYGHVECNAVKCLLQSLPALKHFTLELWTEAYGGFTFFEIASTTLEFLDVSPCRGVYFHDMSLPRLHTLRIARHPMSFLMTGDGPLSTGVIGGGGRSEAVCMHKVLCAGTPNLRQLNDHILSSNWTEFVSEELDQVLSSVCFCRQHALSSPDDS